MAKSYDVTTRQLIEMGPAAWLEYLGIPVSDPSRVRVIDFNLSTILPEVIRDVSTTSMGIHGIEESWLYQEYFQKGRAEGIAEAQAEVVAEGEARGRLKRAREDLLRVGRRKLGDPDESAADRIRTIDDLGRLDALLERIFDVATWEELLAPPAA